MGCEYYIFTELYIEYINSKSELKHTSIELSREPMHLTKDISDKILFENCKWLNDNCKFYYDYFYNQLSEEGNIVLKIIKKMS
jgi:hypothetical protein